ncbi:LCP family protein [Weissella confusa]|uniref:LCP family protein n=1 Tax=Weissella confusa TaxID=1583 RepID=A0A923ND31_WEICO|nr:LCP family protein [Weissella confusa]
MGGLEQVVDEIGGVKVKSPLTFGADMKKSRDVSATIRDGKPFSVLLMGTDTGELGRNDKGRTDSLMIMTINPQKEETTIMSIPRDTLVVYYFV